MVWWDYTDLIVIGILILIIIILGIVQHLWKNNSRVAHIIDKVMDFIKYDIKF